MGELGRQRGAPKRWHKKGGAQMAGRSWGENMKVGPVSVRAHCFHASEPIAVPEMITFVVQYGNERRNNSALAVNRGKRKRVQPSH